MGTNWYTLKGEHIGKSSAAGWYCYKCRLTLCKYGEEWVHSTHPEVERQMDIKYGYPRDGTNIHRTIESNQLSTFDRCPGCDTEKSTKEKQTCVDGCISFTWAMNGVPKRIKYVKNEYGDKMTREEFMERLDKYPIKYYHSIGVEFS